MLELPNVMLCAISSVAIDQTVAALEQSCRSIQFGDAVFITDVDPHFPKDSPIRWQEVSPIRSKEEYSFFMLKELYKFTTCEFVLIVQWDGYVSDPGKWNDAFLNYDYIGATWPQFEDGLNVGNGGFSLRSRRLLEVLASEDFPPTHPEDVAIGRLWRRKLERHFGIRFPEAALATTFSCERSGDVNLAFGFHGMFNMLNFLTSEQIRQMSVMLPTNILISKDYADLVMRSSQYGMKRLAWSLFIRRFLAKPVAAHQLKIFGSLLRNKKTLNILTIDKYGS